MFVPTTNYSCVTVRIRNCRIFTGLLCYLRTHVTRTFWTRSLRDWSRSLILNEVVFASSKSRLLSWQTFSCDIKWWWSSYRYWFLCFLFSYSSWIWVYEGTFVKQPSIVDQLSSKSLVVGNGQANWRFTTSNGGSPREFLPLITHLIPSSNIHLFSPQAYIHQTK